jgi:hypothetical protein
MKTTILIALFAASLTAKEPLAQRIVHTDPSKYRTA